MNARARVATRVLCALALLACAGAHAATSASKFGLVLTVELDPASRRLSALAELVSPGDLAFALHESLAVHAAFADGRAIAPRSNPGGGHRIWRIAAPRGARLRIEYGGTLPPLDRSLDHRAVLHPKPPMASSAGSFLPAASLWYPQVGSAFTYSVRLSLPADQRGLVAGRLVAETLPAKPGERYVAQFEFTQPTDGIDLMAGPYVVREKLVPRERDEPLRLRTYFYSDLESLAESYLEDSARYIALYSQRIGAYPYAGFSVVASPLPTGLGMPTLTYIGAQVLKLPFIRATSLGHEVLHNWWGNGVYVDYGKGNWSEGLTTFMADYFYKEQESADAAREMRLSWLRDFAAVPEGAHLPLTAFRSRTHGAEAAVGYGKSAMVFFMLRDAIGEEAFHRGTRLVWERHRFKVAGWDDLRRAFEEASGRSLAAFFQQWVERAGGPRIAVSDARAHTLDRVSTLELTVTQSSPPYALQVPLEIVVAGKSERRSIPVAAERENIVLQLGYVPQGVRVDPDLRLWRVLGREEVPPILRQWIIARAPRLAIVSSAPDVKLAADSLARSFFEAPPQVTTPAAIKAARAPILLAGLHPDVDAALVALGLPPRPAEVDTRGSAQVWTIAATAATPPVAVVSARDADALTALSRPLPHYGSQSYLVFDGAQAIARGVWPASAPLVAVRREP